MQVRGGGHTSMQVREEDVCMQVGEGGGMFACR